MNKIETQKIELRKLLGDDYFFKVPSYQRPYSWEDIHFNQLIDDITSANYDQEYFFGTIVLHHREEDNIYDVVDGQQRLTTLLVLLAVLRDLIENQDFKEDIQSKIIQKAKIVDGIPEKIRLEVKDIDMFNELVKVENGTKKDLNPDQYPEPKSRYIFAANIFKKKLESLQQTELQKLTQFLSQKCIIILLSTKSFDDAFRLFTIVNDRGKQLRRIDILKAINLDPNVIASESIRNKYSLEWEVFENNLGEDNFESLFYLLRSILLQDKMHQDLIQEFENKIFSKKILSKGSDFFDKLFKYAKIYCSLFIDYDFLQEDDINYFKFNNLLYLMDKEFKASEWKSCLLLYIEKYNNHQIYEFLLNLEKLYLFQWTQIYRKDDRSKVYNAILSEIFKSKTDSDVFKIKEFNVDIKAIEDSLSVTNFYEKNYCKYILEKLEFLSSENTSIRKYFAKTIEHVLPQNPAINSTWKQTFNENQINEWKNKLANLILLSKSKNSSAQNFEFQMKKEKYFQNKISEFPRSLKVMEIQNWTPDVLNERQKEATSLLMSEYQ